MQLMLEKINWIILKIFLQIKGIFQKMSRNSYFSCPVEGQVCSFLPNRWVWSSGDLTKFRRCLTERAETGRFSSLPPWCHVQRKYRENGSKTMLAHHSVEIQIFFLTTQILGEIEHFDPNSVLRLYWSWLYVYNVLTCKIDFTVSSM